MISFIKGKLFSIKDSIAVIDCNGMGYELFVSNPTAVNLPKVGSDVMLFAYLSVREDGMSLFGFSSPEEKEMFLNLTSVSGIGPKLAMSVLSGMELSSLALAIVTADIKSLAKIKGLGKKTAERIVLELKEKLAKESLDLATDALQDKFIGIVTTTNDKDSLDAISALRSLGFTSYEAEKAVAQAKPISNNIEQLIANALKLLK